MIKRTVTIEIHDDGSGGDYTVRDGERYCPKLCWDEMIGTIAELTHPRLGAARYRMLTAAEHEVYEQRRRRRYE